MNKEYYPPHLVEKAAGYEERYCAICHERLTPRVYRRKRGGTELEHTSRFGRRQTCGWRCTQVYRQQRRVAQITTPKAVVKVRAVLKEYQGLPLYAADIMEEGEVRSDEVYGALKQLIERGEVVVREGEQRPRLFLMPLEEAA